MESLVSTMKLQKPSLLQDEPSIMKQYTHTQLKGTKNGSNIFNDFKGLG